jgi:hypothetical protein
VDARTLLVRTHGTRPLLRPASTPSWWLPDARRAAEAQTTADFNAASPLVQRPTGCENMRRASECGDVLRRKPQVVLVGAVAPSLTRVTFKIIATTTARVRALRAGDVDSSSAVPSARRRGLERDPNITSGADAQPRWVYAPRGGLSPGVADRGAAARAQPLEGRPRASGRGRWPSTAKVERR